MMKIYIVFFLTVIATCHASLNEEWINFQNTFDKTYKSPIEARRRMSIFANNLERIAAHNARYEQGETTYKLGVTQFADMTQEEFMETVVGGTGPTVPEDFVSSSNGIFRADDIEDDNIPDSVDWRTTGKVSEVKNQAACGSCWTFSVTGVLESMVRIKYDRDMLFSEQNLVDCVKPPNYGSNGCRGGVMTEAFKYVRDKGIESEGEYPYTAKDGTCNQTRIVLQITGYQVVEENIEALRRAIALKGPISVGIEAQNDFQLYKGGIFKTANCGGRIINHAVLAVGYGSENGQDYWLVKNSWGAAWGENGYVKMERNKEDKCSITRMASYPIRE